VEEIQNSRENFYIDQQYEKFRKKKCLWKSLEFWSSNSTSHPEHLFLLIFFYFQVTLVTKTKINEDDNFLEIFLGRLQRQVF
jgi:hypothetical protein